ncbi:hypothetical protein C0992_007360 [Termitomyces sp. T32_za158]|nr:hypothetical protein C0992_007360 [Termitomyces sp. T32_za158]
MDRSGSTSSNASASSRNASSGPFAYQTRLLERTSSKGGGSSLLRSNSQTGVGILPTVSGTPTNTRKWTHRVVNSFDTTRDVWEERAREAIFDDNSSQQTCPTKDEESSRASVFTALRKDLSLAPEHEPTTSPTKPTTYAEHQRTPPYLKRHTMPAPITASQLSPNTTGLQTNSSFLGHSSSSKRVLPLAVAFHSSIPAVDTAPSSESGEVLVNCLQRSKTLDALPPQSQSTRSSFSPTLQLPSKSSFNTSSPEVPASSQRPQRTLLSSSTARSLEEETNNLYVTQSSPSSTHSVITTPVYRSSYMANKKATYGDALGSGRRLGRHLPRIASGDAEEPLELQKKAQETFSDSQRQKDMPNRALEQSSEKGWKKERVVPLVPVPNADDVAGLPGRIQLKAPSVSSSPLPSSRLMGSSWADTQRHLIHAYEYLCHVGEAQQWIEGCLGEELEFGVVELEDGLRNGVVLAKLVRVFQGDSAVRKIYDVRFGIQ